MYQREWKGLLSRGDTICKFYLLKFYQSDSDCKAFAIWQYRFQVMSGVTDLNMCPILGLKAHLETEIGLIVSYCMLIIPHPRWNTGFKPFLEFLWNYVIFCMLNDKVYLSLFGQFNFFLKPRYKFCIYCTW